MISWKKTLRFVAPIAISLGLVVGASVCIWQSSKNYVLSDEFGKTNAYRIKLNYDVTDEDSLENTAKNFSNYLKYKNISTYGDVYIDEDSSNNAYLNFSLPLERGVPFNDPSADPDTKQDIPGLTTLFNNMNSNDISFLIDLDTSKTGSDINSDTAKASNVIFNTSNLITSDNQITAAYNHPDKLVLKLNDSATDTDIISKSNWHQFYESFVKSQSDDSTVQDDPTTATPEIYIIKDKETLISRMHYILDCVLCHNVGKNIPDNMKYYSYETGYDFLSSDEIEWAKAVLGDSASYTKNTPYLSGSLFNNNGSYTPYATNIVDFFNNIDPDTQYASTISTNSGNGYANGNWYADGMNDDAMFYRLIDCDRTKSVYSDTYATIPSGIGADDSKTFGNDWGWNWMKPYILGIMNKSNFTSFFPDKNPLEAGSKSDEKNIGNWMVLGNNDAEITKYSAYDIKLLKNSLYFDSNKDRMSNTLPFNVIRESNDWNWANEVYGDSTGSLFQNLADTHSVFTFDRKLNNGWTISSPVVGMFVAIIVILLLIGILVSVLYRIPGALFFANLYSTVGFTLFFLTIAGKIISLGLLLGIVGGIIIAVASFFAIMQRMKKHTSKNDFVINAVKKGAVKGLWQFVDLHLTSIILGACLLYFGILSSVNFGISLMIFSLISFGAICIWAISCLLLFWNKYNDKNVEYIFDQKTLPELDLTTHTDDVMECSYASTKKFKKFNSFGLKKETISLGVIFGIVILGLILLFTVGMPNSYELFGGCKIVIFTNGTLNPNDIYSQLSGLEKWSIVKQSDCWILTTSASYNSVLDQIKNHSGYGSDFLLQMIPPYAFSNDIVTLIIATLIIGGFLSLYSCIRLNWTSIVPTFIAICFTPLLLISIFAICQIYVNSEILIFYCLFMLINSVFTFTFIANINNAWIKQKFHTVKKLREVINNEIKTMAINYYLYLVSIIAGITLILLFFCSTTLIVPIICILISLVCTIATLSFIVKPILFWFIIARYWYKIKVSQNNIFFLNNYDTIDEQTIEGINMHRKNKITL